MSTDQLRRWECRAASAMEIKSAMTFASIERLFAETTNCER